MDLMIIFVCIFSPLSAFISNCKLENKIKILVYIYLIWYLVKPLPRDIPHQASTGIFELS